MKEISTLIARRDAQRAPLSWLRDHIARLDLKVRIHTEVKYQQRLLELVDRSRLDLSRAEARCGEALAHYKDTVEAKDIAREELEHITAAVQEARHV